jgi:hypothetical protein
MITFEYIFVSEKFQRFQMFGGIVALPDARSNPCATGEAGRNQAIEHPEQAIVIGEHAPSSPARARRRSSAGTIGRDGRRGITTFMDGDDLEMSYTRMNRRGVA